MGSRGLGVWFLVGLALAVPFFGMLTAMPGRWIEWLPGIDRPRIVVEATSSAVAFRVPEITNLVSHARPDFGVTAGPGAPEGHPLAGFEGLPLDSVLERRAAWLTLGADPARADEQTGASVVSIRHLEVTAGCMVRLESIVGRPVRLEIVTLAADTAAGNAEGPCLIHADLLPAGPDDQGFPDYLQVKAEIRPDRPATLRLSREEPLRLRRVPVQYLGFDARGRNGLQKATIDLPEYGLVGTQARRAYPGDVLLLDSVEGDLVDIVVAGDRIESVFNGMAAEARLRGESLRPDALRTLAYSETYVLIASLTLGLFSLSVALARLWR